MVDSFKDVVDVIVYCSHSIEPFFSSGGRVFVVVIGVYGAWIIALETAVGGEFVGSGGCGLIGKSCER